MSWKSKMSSCRKKALVVPAFTEKKKDEQIVENYHPISFLSIVGEILERILYNMFEFITENNLTFPN